MGNGLNCCRKEAWKTISMTPNITNTTEECNILKVRGTPLPLSPSQELKLRQGWSDCWGHLLREGNDPGFSCTLLLSLSLVTLSGQIHRCQLASEPGLGGHQRQLSGTQRRTERQNNVYREMTEVESQHLQKYQVTKKSATLCVS